MNAGSYKERLEEVLSEDISNGAQTSASRTVPRPLRLSNSSTTVVEPTATMEQYINRLTRENSDSSGSAKKGRR
jgi:hypothetical protein